MPVTVTRSSWKRSASTHVTRWSTDELSHGVAVESAVPVLLWQAWSHTRSTAQESCLRILDFLSSNSRSTRPGEERSRGADGAWMPHSMHWLSCDFVYGLRATQHAACLRGSDTRPFEIDLKAAVLRPTEAQVELMHSGFP